MILGIIFILVICLLFWGIKIKRQRKVKVMVVSTGCPKVPFPMPAEKPSVIKLPSGHYDNTRNFVKVIIFGDDLEDLGVVTGDEWLVSPKFSEIKPGDVVLLQVHKDSQVLREVSRVTEDGLETSWKTWYDQVIQENYNFEDIFGVLRYKINLHVSEVNKSRRN